MIISEFSGKITPSQDKTNISHGFYVPNGIKKLVIEYSYSPKSIQDTALAEQAIRQGMKKYDIKSVQPEKFMPVNNLVPLSFDENGKYRGACHRQPNKQRIIIAEKNSTAGIFNRSIESGEWCVMLNVHFAGCNIDYNIKITGEVE